MVESEDSTKSENLCNSLAELALKIWLLLTGKWMAAKPLFMAG